MILPSPNAIERIRKIAAHREEPFYWYDSDEIRNHCRAFAAIAYEPKSVHFATMANANRTFLRIVREAGLNVFVNSLGHLRIAREVGYSGREIVFTSSGMSETLMRAVHAEGAIINLDSMSQLRRFRRLFPGESVGLRCNIGERVTPRKTHGGYFLGRDSRLGLDLHELESLHGDPLIEGLHLYLGTDIVDLDYYRECYEVMADLAQHFPNLDFIDFGGGFGIPEDGDPEFPMEEYGKMATQLMARVSERAGRPIRLLLEPGRIIGATAGYLAVRVTDVKERNGRQLVGVNASSAQFTRPLLYPEDAYHPVFRLEGPMEPTVPSAVYGSSTYSRDFLAHDIQLPRVQEDEWLVMCIAGSYCASSHTRFLGFEPIEEIFS